MPIRVWTALRRVLIIDETGDRKRGRGIVLAARQYIGKLGHTANGVVSVTSHWADGTLHVPLGVLGPGRVHESMIAAKLRLSASRASRILKLGCGLIRKARLRYRVSVLDCADSAFPAAPLVRPLGEVAMWQMGPVTRSERK